LSEDDTSRFMTIEGQPVPEPARRKVSQFHYVSADYFQALGVELVKGRFFNDRDTYDAQPVAIVNERFVRDFLFGEEPLGKRISPGDRGWYEIVGVVNDARFVSLGEEPMPECYGTYFQFFNLEMTMVVRAEADPRNLIGSIRSEVLAVDPDQPIANIQTMTERISNSVARPRYTATLVSLFAVLALVLAAVGIYGVVSYSVLQRTREIGIRIALGAQRRDVLLLGLKQGLGLTVLGVVVGIAGAFALTRVLGSLLYGVTPTDPLTFTMVSLLLTGVALIACWIPARRATRVDPMVALRYE
jgi:putative ABC transport system permease protein